MKKPNPIYDAFISYGPQDTQLAADVTCALRNFGLAVFDAKAAPMDKHLEDAVWEAMAECQALVAVISDAAPSAATVFELGAAQGWNKPIYIVVADPARAHLPEFLRRMPVFPFSRLEEIAAAIKNSQTALSDAEKSVLIDEYLRIGESVDELVLQPALSSKLVKQFKRRARRQASPEELLQTLLRLRKRGELPALSRKARGTEAK